MHRSTNKEYQAPNRLGSHLNKFVACDEAVSPPERRPSPKLWFEMAWTCPNSRIALRMRLECAMLCKAVCRILINSVKGQVRGLEAEIDFEADMPRGVLNIP